MKGKEHGTRREVTRELSASVTARTGGISQHFTRCMHTLTHKELDIYKHIHNRTQLQKELRGPVPNYKRP